MHCGDQYPDKPPTIQFINEVNLPCVNPKNGVVDPAKLPCLANWSRDNTMETVLIELRRYVGPISRCVGLLLTDGRYMAHPTNKKLPQPPEGSTYS